MAKSCDIPETEKLQQAGGMKHTYSLEEYFLRGLTGRIRFEEHMRSVMGKRLTCFLSLCYALSLWGCLVAVPPNLSEQSAIAYGNQVIKSIPGELQTSHLRDEGDYRTWRVVFYRPADEDYVQQTFAPFCQHHGGTMYYRRLPVCKQGSDDEEHVKFLITSHSEPKGFIKRIVLTVYEPVAAPSPKFFQEVRQLGYTRKAEDDETAEAMARPKAPERQAAREPGTGQAASSQSTPVSQARTTIKEWPVWEGGVTGQPMHSRSGPPLKPEELFRMTSPSVYVVIAAPSQEHLKREDKVAQGSAVAVSPTMLVTNCHIFTGRPFAVLLQKNATANVRLRQADPKTDLYLLQVEGLTLISVKGVRSTTKLTVGEKAYNVGAPRGLEHTFGDGLVSAVRMENEIAFVQTTAPISPGSSGGGLFDSYGNLIGITTLGFKESQALNFAIGAEAFWR